MNVNLTELAQSVLLVFFCWNDVVSLLLSTLAELVECLCKFEDLGSATGSSNFGSLEFGVMQPVRKAGTVTDCLSTLSFGLHPPSKSAAQC